MFVFFFYLATKEFEKKWNKNPVISFLLDLLNPILCDIAKTHKLCL